VGQQRRRLAAILAADVAGYSRLTGADEEGTLERLRALRREVVDPALVEHHGRLVKTTGDGLLVEFASVVDAVRCAIAVQRGMAHRNTEVAPERRILFRVGINLGDVVVEEGDLLGAGVNVAARLEGLARPGGICISGAVYDQVRDKLPGVFTDLGEQSFKNILRPVRTYALQPKGGAPSSDPQAGAEAPRYGVIILPFLSFDAPRGRDSFADSLTESLTTDLSDLCERSVISRNQAYRYKGKPVDMKRLRRNLGVRYAVEGSVSHGVSRIRVNVQLIDAETGGHLWAERFDKIRGDPLEMQHEIATRVARDLVVQLRDAEARRVAKEGPAPASPGDLTARAFSVLNRGLGRERSAEARRLLEEALRLDERNVLAAAGLALVIVGQQLAGWNPRSAAEARRATELADRALAVDARHPSAQSAKANTLILAGKPAAAAEVARRLVELEPMSGHAVLAFAEMCMGMPEEAIRDAEKSLALNPNDERFVNFNLATIGKAHLFLGNADGAVVFLERSANRNPHLDWTFLHLACAYADVGRMPEAADAVASALALSPDWTLRKVDAIATARTPPGRWQAILEALRKAGLPE
jgi:adenylate cyclase